MWIKVSDVVRLGVGRPKVIEACAYLDAQISSRFPTVGDKSFRLIESEEANRIVISFAVGPEVSE